MLFNRWKPEVSKQKVIVTLEPTEKQLYDELLFRINNANTATEVKIYYNQAIKIVENATKRKSTSSLLQPYKRRHLRLRRNN